jgi:hypothetical protein
MARPQGGDVEGERPIDMFGAQGEAVRVADASFDPGYSLDTTLSDAGVVVSKADLLRGFCTYGKVIGEG